MNIHALASSVLPSQSIAVETYASRALNDLREWATTYSVPVTIIVNVQAVPKSVYEHLGLDLQKTYINIYTDYDIQDLKRSSTPDKITFNGDTYQAESSTDWKAVAGYKAILAVKI